MPKYKLSEEKCSKLDDMQRMLDRYIRDAAALMTARCGNCVHWQTAWCLALPSRPWPKYSPGCRAFLRDQKTRDLADEYLTQAEGIATDILNLLKEARNA